MEFLTPDQREDYHRYGLFTVESQFHRRYQIARVNRFGLAVAKIRRLEQDNRGGWRPVEEYCFLPAAGYDSLPEPDFWLAAALWLSCNERRFLRTAVSRPIASALSPPVIIDFALIQSVCVFLMKVARARLHLLLGRCRWFNRLAPSRATKAMPAASREEETS
ncbi:hypothetical protein [Candidatus Binatus sp.]|uniref:hypothetical protein n=1 Tax=Candidatus Binatus sp. TaxID=2811406 RepID=UPI003BB1D976